MIYRNTYLSINNTANIYIRGEISLCFLHNKTATPATPRTPIPTTITVYKDKSFTFETKQPPVTFLIMQATGIKKGSSSTGKGFIGKITKAQIEDIAKKKMVDMNADTLEAAMQMIRGSAISMGFEVVE